MKSGISWNFIMTNDDFIKPHFVILSINDIQKTRRYLYFRQLPGFGGIINIKKKEFLWELHIEIHIIHVTGRDVMCENVNP